MIANQFNPGAATLISVEALNKLLRDRDRLDWLEAQQAVDPDPTLPAPTFRESIDMVMKAETKNEHENNS